jgi:hypothetical protein
VRVSVCHCLACQKRSGSAFSAQARWPDDQVKVSGTWKEWERKAESGRFARYRFCPDCGSTVAYAIEAMPGITAVPIGCFEDAELPTPRFSIYEDRKHPWVEIVGEEVEHLA